MKFNKGDKVRFKNKNLDKDYGELTIVSDLFYCEELSADGYECLHCSGDWQIEEVIAAASAIIPAKLHRMLELQKQMKKWK